MNKPIVVFLLALTAFASRTALPQPDLVAQAYFAGSEKILAAPNVKYFENEFCNMNALALRPSWLEARNFPGCYLNSPPLPERMQMQLRERRTGIIIPPMGH